MKSWLDGRLVEADEAWIPAADRGLTIGEGVFETILVQGGVPFALTRHLERLRLAATRLGLPSPELAELRQGIAEVLGQADLGRARLRITITSGVGPLDADRAQATPTRLITVSPLAAPQPTATLATVPYVRNERSPLTGLKATSYAENSLAQAQARRLGATEAVMADSLGRLSECAASNVFVVLAGRVLTPSLDCGCLPGITRALLLEWGAAVAEVEEARLPYAILDGVDEIFLTSSLRGVQPVTRLDGRDLGVGPISAALRELYDSRAASDVDP